jgi:hypothetical protein
VALVRPFRRRKGLDRSAARAVEARFTVALSPDDMLSGLPIEFRDTVNAAYTKATEALSRAEQVDSRVRPRMSLERVTAPGFAR